MPQMMDGASVPDDVAVDGSDRGVKRGVFESPAGEPLIHAAGGLPGVGAHDEDPSSGAGGFELGVASAELGSSACCGGACLGESSDVGVGEVKESVGCCGVESRVAGVDFGDGVGVADYDDALDRKSVV